MDQDESGHFTVDVAQDKVLSRSWGSPVILAPYSLGYVKETPSAPVKVHIVGKEIAIPELHRLSLLHGQKTGNELFIFLVHYSNPFGSFIISTDSFKIDHHVFIYGTCTRRELERTCQHTFLRILTQDERSYPEKKNAECG